MQIDLSEARLKAMAKTLRAELGANAPSYQASLDILARVLGAKTFEQLKPQLTGPPAAERLDADALARALAPFARARAVVEAADPNVDDEPEPAGRRLTLSASNGPEADYVCLGDFRTAYRALKGTSYLPSTVDSTPYPDATDDPDDVPETVALTHPHGDAPLTVHLVRVFRGADPDCATLIDDARERITDSGLGGHALVTYRFLDGRRGQPRVLTHDQDEIPIFDPVSLRREGRRTKRERTLIRSALGDARTRLGLARDQQLTAYATDRGLFAVADRDIPAFTEGRKPVAIALFLDGYDRDDPAGEASVPGLLADIEELFS